tara:strand:- start:191935 stop:192618 length:684 start_codon:yes stop_codon:yes gene_type:complete
MAIAGLLIMSSACASNDVQPVATPTAVNERAAVRQVPSTMVYECTGYEFVTRTGPGEIAVWLNDRYVVLPQVRAASGVKYEDSGVTFWTKGSDAMLTIDGQNFGDCREMPARVPWEDARRRGVDFRGTGNEPGWYLEVQQGRQILFVGDYGNTRVATPDPGATSDNDVREYHAITEANDLHVVIVEQPCVDTMQGDTFPNRVVVTLNGKSVEGCGKDLDWPWQESRP